MFEAEVTILKAKALIDQTKWSKHSLALEAGLSANALRSLDSDNFGATPRTLRKISAALTRIADQDGIDLNALLEKWRKNNAFM